MSMREQCRAQNRTKYEEVAECLSNIVRLLARSLARRLRLVDVGELELELRTTGSSLAL